MKINEDKYFHFKILTAIGVVSTINKHTIDRFKAVADKDMRKMSNIVENLIRRYVESRV
mgnify:CR=1 FL=1